jgi:hypothetical protein
LSAKIEIVIIHAKEYFELWSKALNDSIFKKEAFVKAFLLIEKEIERFAKKHGLRFLRFDPEWSLVRNADGLTRSISIVPLVGEKKILLMGDASKKIRNGYATLSKKPSISIGQENIAILGDVLKKILEAVNDVNAEDIRFIPPQGMYGPGPFSR